MILCYHEVDPDWRSSLSVTPREFRAHCEWLAANRQVVSLKELMAELDGTMLPPPGRVALTFDDGFRGVHEHALPILAEFGFPATVFVVTDTVTGNQPVDWIDGEEVGSRRVLTVGQLLELRDEGVDLQSHTCAHKDLTTLGHTGCVDDLKRSRVTLEDLTGDQVDQLAYPRGRHDEVVREAAEVAGFEWGFSLPEQKEAVGPFSVPRVGIYPGNGTATLAVKTRPAYLAFRHGPVFPFIRRIVRRDKR